jgi:chromosome segregation ATPase
MTNARIPFRFSVLVVLAVAAGCSSDKPGSGAKQASKLDKSDSIVALNTQLKARADELQKVSVEKDTLITTLQTAMSLTREIESLQKEMVTRSGKKSAKTDEGVITWDAKVRSQINDIRKRHRQLRDALARANARLKEMTATNTAMAAQLEQAMQTITQLQADNAQQAGRIRELAARLEGLEKDKSQLLAVNKMKTDSIDTLVSDKNRVYWISGTKDSLKQLGVIKQQGGRSLLITRVGETYTPADGLNPAVFHVLDKSHDNQIALPDNADYEIVSPQNVAYAEPVVPKKRRVKSQLVIKDQKFWDNSKFLILLRH